MISMKIGVPNYDLASAPDPDSEVGRRSRQKRGSKPSRRVVMPAILNSRALQRWKRSWIDTAVARL
jgi:hypothetical protein